MSLFLLFPLKAVYFLAYEIFAVDVAQLVEHQIVALVAVGSNPTIHPSVILKLITGRGAIW